MKNCFTSALLVAAPSSSKLSVWVFLVCFSYRTGFSSRNRFDDQRVAQEIENSMRRLLNRFMTIIGRGNHPWRKDSDKARIWNSNEVSPRETAIVCLRCKMMINGCSELEPRSVSSDQNSNLCFWGAESFKAGALLALEWSERLLDEETCQSFAKFKANKARLSCPGKVYFTDKDERKAGLSPTAAFHLFSLARLNCALNLWCMLTGFPRMR